MKKAFVVGILVASGALVSPVLAAGKFNVIQLKYETRFGKTVEYHFMPAGGFTSAACKQSLQPAIDDYGPDFGAAVKRNFGTELASAEGLKFVEGNCVAVDIPPGQLMNLKRQ
ncbi:MAG: hypothetical protein JWQ22_2506 [Devosia sp.]|nr:hypothetical protein [Devosia sp.]